MAAKRQYPELVMKTDDQGTPILIFDGVKIAERGKPGSPQARTWVSLEPGYTVYMTGNEIVVEYNGVRLH
jgi:hypothetical protein